MPYRPGVLELHVEVEGETEFRRRLSGVMLRLRSLRPVFEAIAEDFRRHMVEVFATEGGATESGRWPELSKAYGTWKARHYPGMPILQRGDRRLGRGPRLAPSLTQRSHPDHLLELGDHEMTVGSRVPYGIYHQSRRPRSRLPRRPMIDLPDAVKTRWVQQLSNFLWQEDRHGDAG